MRKMTIGIILSMAWIGGAHAGSIQVDEAWAATVEDGAEVEVFMRITNNGAMPDRLYGVRTSVANVASLNLGGEEMEQMGEHQAVAALELPPSESFRLHEDGPHIMLEEMSAAVALGDTVTLTLFFEQAGPVNIDVSVTEEETH